MMTQNELTQQESIDHFVKWAEERIDDGDFSGRSEQAIRLVIKALTEQPSLDENGLAACGCGGKPYPHFQLGWYREDSDSQAFEVCIGCDECGLSTKPRRGLYIKGEDTDETEMKSKGDWNTAMGYHD